MDRRPEPFKLETIFEQYEHVPGMLVLGASDASSLTVHELLRLCDATVDFEGVRLGYGDVRGDPRLRQAVAHSYGAAVSADDVLVTLGGSEAIYLVMHALLEPDDAVVVCAPAYQPLRSIAAAIGAVIEEYPYVETVGIGFAPDLEGIRQRLKRARPPKLLVLNTPHNPTGHVIDEVSVRSLLALAKASGVTVLVDEVFSGIWLGATAPVPSALTIDSEAIVIGSLSKTYGLSGLRVGWLAGPRAAIGACRRMRHYTTISPPVLVQEVAVVAMEHREVLLERTGTIVRRNHAAAVAWLDRHRDFFSWLEPAAGLVMLIRLTLPVEDEPFIHHLAKERGVFLVPCASTFDMPKGYLRLGLGTDPDTLREGLDRLSDYLTTGAWRALVAGA